jgi:hypothetical protein
LQYCKTGIESRISSMTGECSTIWATPSIWDRVSLIFPELALNSQSFCFYLPSSSWDYRRAIQHPT